MIRAQCKLVVVIGLVLMAGMAWAQQDPIPPPSSDNDAILIAVQVAKVAPQAFSLSRAQNNQFDRVVRAFRNDRFNRASRIWLSLIQDIFEKGGPLPNFDAMAYTVAREAILEENGELVQTADALRFRTERLRIIREELTLLAARIDSSTDSREIDELELERQNRNIAQATAKQQAEDAEKQYRQSLEDIRFALEKIYNLVAEMQSQIRKVTGVNLQV